MFNCFNSWQNIYPFKIVRYKDKTKDEELYSDTCIFIYDSRF